MYTARASTALGTLPIPKSRVPTSDSGASQLQGRHSIENAEPIDTAVQYGVPASTCRLPPVDNENAVEAVDRIMVPAAARVWALRLLVPMAVCGTDGWMVGCSEPLASALPPDPCAADDHAAPGRMFASSSRIACDVSFSDPPFYHFRSAIPAVAAFQTWPAKSLMSVRHVCCRCLAERLFDSPRHQHITSGARRWPATARVVSHVDGTDCVSEPKHSLAGVTLERGYRRPRAPVLNVRYPTCSDTQILAAGNLPFRASGSREDASRPSWQNGNPPCPAPVSNVS
ncbi:hypothetical protein EVG20_g9899 [Dentipellis fragilis]|uniref:Uncharacterized protein n=1 Tax=Dentipellis fragilis TaxID=205917 RepID=A0A4Y9XZC6_9AGAM|nr:hypothetical protein EVG20_g9899 [Dentipellis fragilis]